MKTSPNTHGPIRPSSRSDEYGELQRLVDEIYRVNPSKSVSKVDVVIEAEVLDLDGELMEVMSLIPAGSYRRSRLCDQINSIVTAHGWAFVYGTVE
jgi:hypothetical protein